MAVLNEAPPSEAGVWRLASGPRLKCVVGPRVWVLAFPGQAAACCSHTSRSRGRRAAGVYTVRAGPWAGGVFAPSAESIHFLVLT